MVPQLCSLRSKENHGTDRILSLDESIRLLAHCPARLESIVKVAYHTGMKPGELLNLTWGQVDLKEGFMKLDPEPTKTRKGRRVPLTWALVTIWKTMVRGLLGVNVFTRNGDPIKSIGEIVEGAGRKAGIDHFTFHDLRRTAVNNWWLQGHDYFRIMAATGHKTMTVFKRYNTVSREELKALTHGHHYGPQHQNQRGAI